MITKFSSSINLRYQLFSNCDNLREQSRRHCFDQEFSISRMNKAHRYSNSLHQRKNDRRFHRFDLRVYRLNNN